MYRPTYSERTGSMSHVYSFLRVYVVILPLHIGLCLDCKLVLEIII